MRRPFLSCHRIVPPLTPQMAPYPITDLSSPCFPTPPLSGYPHLESPFTFTFPGPPGPLMEASSDPSRTYPSLFSRGLKQLEGTYASMNLPLLHHDPLNLILPNSKASVGRCSMNVCRINLQLTTTVHTSHERSPCCTTLTGRAERSMEKGQEADWTNYQPLPLSPAL